MTGMVTISERGIEIGDPQDEAVKQAHDTPAIEKHLRKHDNITSKAYIKL
jgi:hypothetical protein